MGRSKEGEGFEPIAQPSDVATAEGRRPVRQPSDVVTAERRAPLQQPSEVVTADRRAPLEPPSDVATADDIPKIDLAAPEPDAPKPRAQPISAASRAVQDRRIGRFTVLGTLGRGGMGIVLRAYDETLARMVALKLLNRRFAGPRQQRLLREGQALAQLSHPNVVHVYEMGMVEDQMFIAMELVLGDSLRTWQHEPRPWREILDVYLQAGRGLEAAHERGIIHRDFKPENCIIGDDGRVRVLDFGLARGTKLGMDGPASMSRMSLDGVDDMETSLERKLTQSGTVLGTMRYLPLPQLSGEPSDDKSDQYSFCVSLHEGLYGLRPFPDSTIPELLKSLETQTMVTVPRSRVPKRVRRIILRGLASDPDERWPSMGALLSELERAARPRRWWPLAAAGAVAGLGVAAVTLAYPGDDPCETAAERLHGTWGPADREAVRAAYEGSPHPDASRLLERVEDHLDGFTRAWTEMAESSCRSTFVQRVQSEELFDRRMQCLQRHRSRLRSTIESLAEAQTAQQISERTILPFKMPPVDGCADVDALMARQPPPDDAELRTQVELLRSRIDRANALREIGELTPGIELASAIVEDARALDHAPVLAEALECLGHLQANGGSPRDAEATLSQAIDEAARAKADTVAARAWALLVYARMAQGKLEDGAILERAARAAAERADDAIARGWVLNNLGVLHGERGDAEAALRDLQAALDVKTRAFGQDHVEVGIAWFNLGNMFQRNGSLDEARLALERARGIFEATVGDSHPHVAFVETSLGHMSHTEGKPSEAAEHHRRALAVREAVLGPDHLHTAKSLRYLGEAELELERFTEARAHIQRALAIDERAFGTRDPEVAHALIALANVELAAGAPKVALYHAERAHQMVDPESAPADLLGRARFVLARCQWATRGERAQARALAEQARQALHSRPGSKKILAEIDGWLHDHPVTSGGVPPTG